jgi:hypothetical protein
MLYIYCIEIKAYNLLNKAIKASASPEKAKYIYNN